MKMKLESIMIVYQSDISWYNSKYQNYH